MCLDGCEGGPAQGLLMHTPSMEWLSSGVAEQRARFDFCPFASADPLTKMVERFFALSVNRESGVTPVCYNGR